MKKEIALKYLKQNINKNILLINSINRETADILHADEKAVIIRENINKTIIISTDDIDFGKKFIDKYKFNEMYTILNKELAEYAIKKFKFKTNEKCINAIYKGSEDNIKIDEDIRILDINYLEKITEIYKVVDRDYIDWELRNNKIYGLFIENKLAGFIGEHKEGSIGLLEVFQEYRNQGIGTKLLKFMIKNKLDNNQIPFSQIYIDNEISKNLHRKLGFTVDDNIKNINYWVH